MPFALSVIPGVTLFVKKSSMRLAISSVFAVGAAWVTGAGVGVVLHDAIASTAPAITPVIPSRIATYLSFFALASGFGSVSRTILNVPFMSIGIGNGAAVMIARTWPPSITRSLTWSAP